jgi:hypothetical protein
MASRATYLPSKSTTQSVDFIKPLNNSAVTIEASKFSSAVDFVDGAHVTLDPVGAGATNVVNKGYVAGIAPELTTGQLVVASATVGSNGALAAGTTNQVLVADSTVANIGLKWAACPTAPELAANELIVYSATAGANGALTAPVVTGLALQCGSVSSLTWGFPVIRRIVSHSMVAGAIVVPSTNVYDGVIYGAPGGVGTALTMPNGAALDLLMGSPGVGTGLVLKVINTDANPANTYTVTMPDGTVTLIGGPTIAGSASATLIFERTAVGTWNLFM